MFTYSYLIAIAQKKQVAQLWGKPIFVITDVAFIPLQSQGEAALALRKASDIAKLHDDNGPLERASTDLIEDADNDVLASLEDTWLDDEVARDTVKGLGKAKEPGIAEGVISHKGAYGRFAERWFSKSGWTSGQRRNLGLSLPESSTDPTASTAPHRRKSSSLHVSPALRPLSDFNNGKGAFPEQSEDDVSSEDANTKRVTMSLLPKLLQTLKLLLMSRTFYFSYEVDISRRISSASTIASDTPLFKQFDSQVSLAPHRLATYRLICSSISGTGILRYLLCMEHMMSWSCPSCRDSLGRDYLLSRLLARLKSKSPDLPKESQMQAVAIQNPSRLYMKRLSQKERTSSY